MKWRHVAAAADRRAMLILTRHLLLAHIETDRALLSCYLTQQQEDRQFWLDDFVGFFPEIRN